jgi:curli biogenesis system outer membrane secretion channel CsgG
MSPASSLVDAILNLPVSRDVQGLNEARTAKLLATLFITEFVNQGSQQVRVIERAQFEKVMAEQDLGQSGLLDTETAAKIGKILGVKYLVTGQITRFATKQGGFSTGRLLPTALALTGVGGALTKNQAITGALLTDVNLKNSAFTARLDMRVIEVETGEIVGVAYEEGESKKMGVKIMGAGTDASFDDTLVGQVFEPIVKKITPKLIQKIVNN